MRSHCVAAEKRSNTHTLFIRHLRQIDGHPLAGKRQMNLMMRGAIRTIIDTYCSGTPYFFEDPRFGRDIHTYIYHNIYGEPQIWPQKNTEVRPDDEQHPCYCCSRYTRNDTSKFQRHLFDFLVVLKSVGRK